MLDLRFLGQNLCSRPILLQLSTAFGSELAAFRQVFLIRSRFLRVVSQLVPPLRLQIGKLDLRRALGMGEGNAVWIDANDHTFAEGGAANGRDLCNVISWSSSKRIGGGKTQGEDKEEQGFHGR